MSVDNQPISLTSPFFLVILSEAKDPLYQDRTRGFFTSPAQLVQNDKGKISYNFAVTGTLLIGSQPKASGDDSFREVSNY